jgi:hypothetical protein
MRRMMTGLLLCTAKNRDGNLSTKIPWDHPPSSLSTRNKAACEESRNAMEEWWLRREVCCDDPDLNSEEIKG